MSKKKVSPKWFRHEALHTTNVCAEMVNDHLLNHHYYHSNINPEFNKHIDKALKHLAKAYQAVGNEQNEVDRKITIDAG